MQYLKFRDFDNFEENLYLLSIAKVIVVKVKLICYIFINKKIIIQAHDEHWLGVLI